MRTIGLAVFLLSLAGLADAQPADVVSADSVWIGEKGQRLLRGDRLPDTAPLRADGIGDLVLQCQDTWRLYKCAGPACRVTACAKQASAPLTTRALWKWSLASLLRREPSAPILAVSREGGNPSDAVLRLDGRGLHVGPALTRVLEGRYCLRFGELPAGSAESFVIVNIDWDRAVDSDGMVAGAELSPGLHSLEKGTPTPGSGCEVSPDAVPAWVLVTADQDFERVRGEWTRQNTVITELEREGASRATVTALRHSALASLAPPTR